MAKRSGNVWKEEKENEEVRWCNEMAKARELQQYSIRCHDEEQREERKQEREQQQQQEQQQASTAKFDGASGGFFWPAQKDAHRRNLASQKK